MQSVNRLIKEFIPKSYDLSLSINRLERVFQGTLVIEGKSVNGKIFLHSKDLNIEKVVINNKECKHKLHSNDELEIINANQKPGDIVISIDYSGEITDSLHGLYPCYYKHDGRQKELLMTQFESHHAREVFPCVDEPEAKATFDISLATEESVTVLSNMLIKSEATGASSKVTTFETTPRMSTYLVAFVIGDLQKTTGKTKSGIEVSVYSTPAQSLESHSFPLDHAIRSIDFFEGYFGVPYPLPKSDQVAVPDFSSGAMENWGLVTYRESTLLVDPKSTPLSVKQYIATVISHELSHQWFGNLVTMTWWNELWLNESFASIMEYVAVDAIHPKWNIWREFSASETTVALRRDSIDGVQPVQTDVKHPDEISSLFDGAIVYAKGARLLRMLQLYVGEDAFREGLKKYFTKHAYKNTVGTDLWQALESVSDKKISVLMNTWITQPGFPVINIDAEGSNLSMSQSRFYIGPHISDKNLWPIPLDANTDLSIELFDQRNLKTDFDNRRFIFLNENNGSHFITKYDPDLTVKIERRFADKKLDASKRNQYLNEQLLLARGGQIDSVRLIDILQMSNNESDEKVWGSLGGAIADLKKIADGDKTAERGLKSLVANISRPEYMRLGWKSLDGESEDDTMLRATIIANMVYSEDAETIGQAYRIFQETKLEQIEPEIRGAILSGVVRHHETPQMISALLDIYQTSQQHDMKSDVMYALTSSKNQNTLGKLLGLLTDTSTIKTQDTLYWFVSLLRNSHSRQHSWEWMKNNWSWIEETFGGDKSYDYFPRYTGSILQTRKHLEEYKEFFSKHKKIPALKRTIEMGILDITGRVELIESQSKSVRLRLNNL